MKISKILARKILLPGLLKLNVDKLLLSKSAKDCCIVNFHGVRNENTIPFNNRHLPVGEFEKTIKYLKENYQIVSLPEIFEIHRKKLKQKKKTIALTFDDGYLNNFELALPILKKYIVPATLYIITKSLTQNNYLAWPDVLDIIKKHHPHDITLNSFVFKYPSYQCESLGMDLQAYLKKQGDKTEKLAYELLSQFEDGLVELKTSAELLLLINGDQIHKYKSEDLLEFGSHSHSHFNMEHLDRTAAEKELTTSKNILENAIGKKIITIAFPDGSYTPETVEIAKAAGYENVAAVTYKYDENNKNPNLLSRFTISNSTTFESNILRLAKQFDTFGF